MLHPLVEALAITLAVSETPLARAAAIDALQAKILTAPDNDLQALAVGLVELAYLLSSKGKDESARVMGLLSGLLPRLGPLLASGNDARFRAVRAQGKPRDAAGTSGAFKPAGAGVKVRKN